MSVTVRVAPAGSIIFEHGRRIGVDVVQVKVEPGSKKNLVALRDGYLPRRLTVDGTLNSVSITLRQSSSTTAEAAPAAPAREAQPEAPTTSGTKPVFDPSRDVGSLTPSQRD